MHVCDGWRCNSGWGLLVNVLRCRKQQSILHTIMPRSRAEHACPRTAPQRAAPPQHYPLSSLPSPLVVCACAVCHFSVNPAADPQTTPALPCCLLFFLPLICDDAIKARCNAAITVMSFRPSHTLKPARGTMCRGLLDKRGNEEEAALGLLDCATDNRTLSWGWWEWEGASRQGRRRVGVLLQEA